MSATLGVCASFWRFWALGVVSTATTDVPNRAEYLENIGSASVSATSKRKVQNSNIIISSLWCAVLFELSCVEILEIEIEIVFDRFSSVSVDCLILILILLAG